MSRPLFSAHIFAAVERGGQALEMGNVADGQFIKRDGLFLVGSDLTNFEFFNPDDGSFYSWVPRLSNDGVTVVGQWTQSAGPSSGRTFLNPDNGLYYYWVPRLSNDGVTIVGQWVAV